MRAIYAALCLALAPACLDEAAPKSCPAESSPVAGATCELEDGSHCSDVAAVGCAPGSCPRGQTPELGCCTPDGWLGCTAVAP
jgi:hypothetical protein